MKSKKTELIVIVVSMCLCILMMGITVYAALTQSATITNSVEVKEDGQAKTNINVGYAIGPSNDTDFEALTARPSFTNLISKPLGVDTASTNEVIDFSFSYKNNYRFVIYEVSIQNLSTVPVDYTVNIINPLTGNLTPPPSQCEKAFASNTNTGGGFTLTQDNTLDVGQVAVGETIVFYAILQVRDGLELWDLVQMNSVGYRVQILAKA